MTKEKLKRIENGTGKKQDILENQAKYKNIFLALGSNLDSKIGSRIKNLEIAQLLLISNNIYILERSNYYETLSYPNKRNPKFINCVIKAHTNLNPKKLIEKILDIEHKIGRNRISNKKNEPRVCDIDIIDYKSKIINKSKNPNLTIPHKELHKRNFVLVPLYEICPNWIHPKLKLKIKFLLNKLSPTELNYIKRISNE